MNHTDIRSRLERSVSNVSPSAPPLTRIVHEAHARRRRRRTTLGALVVTLLLGATAAYRSTVGAATDNAVDPTGTLDDVSLCRQGNQSARATNTLFGPGEPEVRLSGTVADMKSVILVSADGQYWADCFINLYAGAEFTSGMTVYASKQPKKHVNGFGFSTGYTCKDLDGPPGSPCPTFMVDYADRVAPEVATVAFETADGVTTRVTAHDGYILFTYSGAVPDGYPQVESPGQRVVAWLRRITYLDTNGSAIAAMNFDDRRSMPVPGLPALDAFPSRRSAPIW